uniref:Ribosomal protein L16 n=1 Tax=Acavomonas peruviana TaxID=1542312 RepID=V5KV68_9ALVE|nr:ribosomal protein L16 [Acavomonas peruviana]
MLQFPRKLYYSKFQKSKNFIKKSKKKSFLVYNLSMFYFKKSFVITYSQMDTFRKVYRRYFGRNRFYTYTWFSHFSYTTKPKLVRMGKGKGSVNYWAFRYKKNFVFFHHYYKYRSFIKGFSFKNFHNSLNVSFSKFCKKVGFYSYFILYLMVFISSLNYIHYFFIFFFFSIFFVFYYLSIYVELKGNKKFKRIF